MVCPLCIASAITANAPIISATVLGGIAAIKISQTEKRKKPTMLNNKRAEVLAELEIEDEDYIRRHNGYLRRK
jgi:hypothetical protein